MKNLKPYIDDCFEYHSYVVSKKNKRKDDPDYKERLSQLDPEIKKQFEKYAELIAKNSLESIDPSSLNHQEKQDLLLLYRFGSKPLQELLINLTTLEGRKFNTCQMCTIEPVGSFDHILPKKKFPEFSVNPINLLPSCKTCNGKKSDRWLENNERIFFNLYYDLLPDAQFLKVNFNSYPIPEFSIDKLTLPSDFYRLAQSHYKELNLFQRFRENSSEVIDSIFSNAKSLVPKIGFEEYKNTVIESSDEMRIIYGLNHWKYLLKVAIVSHKEFMNYLNDKV